MMNDIDNKLGKIDILTIGKNMLEMVMFDFWVNCSDFVFEQKRNQQVVRKSCFCFSVFISSTILFSLCSCRCFLWEKKDGTEQQKEKEDSWKKHSSASSTRVVSLGTIVHITIFTDWVGKVNLINTFCIENF